jgi:hypothetical protein
LFTEVFFEENVCALYDTYEKALAYIGEEKEKWNVYAILCKVPPLNTKQEATVYVEKHLKLTTI